MSELIPSFKLAAAVMLWVLLCCIGPREAMRHSAIKHYRHWVQVRAYWGRAYDKWLIGDRVFYTDELWGDVFFCLVTGPSLNLAYFFLLSQVKTATIDLQLIIAASVSTTIVLFATRQFDRCQIPEEEVARQALVDPSFSREAEITKLLSGDRRFVRRVIGRHARPRTDTGG